MHIGSRVCVVAHIADAELWRCDDVEAPARLHLGEAPRLGKHPHQRLAQQVGDLQKSKECMRAVPF